MRWGRGQLGRPWVARAVYGPWNATQQREATLTDGWRSVWSGSLPSPAGTARDATAPREVGIICLTRGRQGFDFLGFHHRKVESWKWRGKFYLQRWPSARAMGVLRDTGRNWTTRFTYGWITRLGVYRLTGTVRGARCMPAGERCRKAVCGRTACTV